MIISSTPALQSSIALPPVLDSQDLDGAHRVINVVKYPQIPHPDPPGAGAELDTPIGPRGVGEHQQAFAYPLPSLSPQSVQVSLRPRTEQQPIHAFPGWLGRRQG